MLTDNQLNQAKKLGTLIQQSSLAEAEKVLLLNNLAHLPASMVEPLIKALDQDQLILANLLKKFSDFETRRDEAWQKSSIEQETEVDKIIEEEIKNILLEDEKAKLHSDLSAPQA